jgi:hypothetical protein
VQLPVGVRQVSLAAVGLALLLLIALAAAPGLPSSSPVPSGPGPTTTVSLEASPSAGPTATAPGAPTASPRSTSPGASSSAVGPLPAFGHIFVVVMENHEESAIIGNQAAPYINGLARRYGLATDYRAVAHPSEPNYLALWSGSTQGVTNDGVYNFTSGLTLADQVEASGRSWHVAAENVPLGCFRGATASGGPDGGGSYARKHEPAISWTSVSGDPPRCARITDFSHFDPNLGNLWFIVPNLCHDMHDCSIATGDAFLRSWLPTILTSNAFADGVVFLTWDEGSTSIGGGGKVATIVISPLAKAGFASGVRHTHYSLLRTIEDAWRLRCLADACSANDLREFFR